MNSNYSKARTNSHCSILLIAPCYNEEASLNTDYFRSIVRADSKVTLVLVDDGSVDATYSKLSEITQGEPNMRLTRSDKNRGKAEAIRFGLGSVAKLENFDYIGFLDGDGDIPLKNVIDALDLVARVGNFDILWSVRSLKSSDLPSPAKSRYFIGKIISFLLQLGTKDAIANSVFASFPRDTQSGFKIFNSKLIFPTVNKPFLTKWFVDWEMLLRIVSLTNEVPVLYKFELTENSNPSKSTLKFWHVFLVIKEILIIKKLQIKVRSNFDIHDNK